jgi:hypothetical protein
LLAGKKRIPYEINDLEKKRRGIVDPPKDKKKEE